MVQALYDDLVRFASEGRFDPELRQAKSEYIARTGDMFEGDLSFERRLASFLEWYVLDRPVSFAAPNTPAKLFFETFAEDASDLSRQALGGLTQTVLSIYEYLGMRGEHLNLSDVLTGQKVRVFQRERPAGLESGDLIEARLVPQAGQVVLSEALGVLPREARRTILKAGKAFRKRGAPEGERLDLVHRVAFLANRCERYRHLKVEGIFAEL